MTRTQATNTANAGEILTQKVVETDTETEASTQETIDESAGSEPITNETKVETVEINKAELDALQKERAQLRREQRKKDEKLQQIEQQRLANEGQYKELADQYKADAESHKEKYENLRREQICRDVAQRLNFVNPAHAYRLLDTSSIDIDDPSGVENAFKRLAQESPYLISPATGKTGLSMSGKATSMTANEAREKLASMTRKEKIAMSDEKFKALQKQAFGMT